MSVRTVPDAMPRNRSSLRNPLRLLVSSEPWRALLFSILSFVLGVFWFVLLVVLIATGSGTVITLIGLPILALTMLLWIKGARLERARVRALLGVEIQDPYRPLPARGWWARMKVRLVDRHVWLDLLYLLLLLPIGVAEFAIAVFAVGFPLQLLSTPSWFWASNPVIGPWEISALFEAVSVAVIGLPLLLAAPYVLVGLGRGHAWFAQQLLGTDREAELSARVDQLTDSRSRALDSAVSDLRRIERDLHDGAQQRLVKLSMDLGMARAKMESDPEGAAKLISEAHDESKLAMREIRDLARGIHPAVLTDRGLDAAVSALAGRSTVPVTVDVELHRRLPDAVESTAYFIVAEALTNIARHSGATEASIRIRQDDELLHLEIADNGAGGADPDRGTGLAGMRDRVAGLDGTLTVESPTGGPTTIRVELPCELSSPKTQSS